MCWRFRSIARVDDGQGLVEYALVLLFVAVACVMGVAQVGSGVQVLITNASAPFR